MENGGCRGFREMQINPFVAFFRNPENVHNVDLDRNLIEGLTQPIAYVFVLPYYTNKSIEKCMF